MFDVKLFSSSLVTVVLFLLGDLSSHGQMLSGLAGGRVAKGAEREADLKPWLTLGRSKKEMNDSFIPGTWEGFGEGRSIAIPGTVDFTAARAHHWSQLYGLRLEVVVPKKSYFPR